MKLANLNGTYLAVLAHPENTEMLKSEISRHRADLRPSFSEENFMTFKYPSSFTLTEIEKIRPILSLKAGLFYAKINRKNLGEKFKQAEKELGQKFIIDPSSAPKLEIETFLKNEGRDWEGEILNCTQGDVIAWVQLVNQKECWINFYQFRHGHNSVYPLPTTMPREAPSRAYLKMAQTFSLLNLGTLPKPQTFLEIGCSPGGVSYFLLSQGHRVLGLDTGEMDSKLMQSELAIQFKHILKPIQELRKGDLEKPMQRLNITDFEWLANDVNLPLPMAANEVLRVSQYGSQLLGILATLKLPTPESMDQLMQLKQRLHQMNTPFKEFYFVHLPAHKKECLMVALTEKAMEQLQILPVS